MKGVRCTMDNEGCMVMYNGQYEVYDVGWTMKGVQWTEGVWCTMDNVGCMVYNGQ